MREGEEMTLLDFVKEMRPYEHRFVENEEFLAMLDADKSGDELKEYLKANKLCLTMESVPGRELPRIGWDGCPQREYIGVDLSPHREIQKHTA